MIKTVIKGEEVAVALKNGHVITANITTSEPRYYTLGDDDQLYYSDDLITWNKSRNNIDSLALAEWRVVR